MADPRFERITLLEAENRTLWELLERTNRAIEAHWDGYPVAWHSLNADIVRARAAAPPAKK